MVKPETIDYAIAYDFQGNLIAENSERQFNINNIPEYSAARNGAKPIEQSQFRYRDSVRNNLLLDFTVPVFSQVNPVNGNLPLNDFNALNATDNLSGSQHILGYARIAINLNTLERQLYPFAVLIFSVAAVFTLLCALISTVITRRITFPLSRLAIAATELSSGNLDQRLPVTGSGEVRDLTRVVNHIFSGLKSHKTRIDVDRQLLSRKVDERTEQLVQRNSQLKSAIDEANRAKHRLHHLAYYDSLTVLPNRQFFTEQLNFLLRVAKRENHKLALLFIDLDNFKRINDSLGHSAGDLLLKEAAKRLQNCVRDSDLLARGTSVEDSKISVSRLGGDEFTIVLNNITDIKSAAVAAERVLAALSKPVNLEGHELVITPSIGITIAPDDSDNVEGLLRHADTAMYHAKTTGKNRFQYYSSHMNELGVQRLKLETDLRKAVERSELVLHYQPQVSIITGEIVGAEAMVRWQHPEHGLIPPMQFIPVAEEMGLIVDLGEFVLTQACKQMNQWQKQGIIFPKIAVNVSSLQFNHAWFIERIKQALEETGLTPGALELELTESVIMNNADATVDALNELKELGVSLSVDDFGTGYSSLNYLNRFPLDELKIDRSFIMDLGKDKHSAGLVSAIIAMAKSLDLKLVAEGVETEYQCKFLRDEGIEVIQGFLFSKAVPVEEFAALVRSNSIKEKVARLASKPILTGVAASGR